MEFLIFSADKPDSLHIRQSTRDAHLAWLKQEGEVTVLSAGPWLDDEGVMRGSLLIVRAQDKKAVKDWLKRDPYKLAGLPARTRIRRFIWAIGQADR